MLKGWKRRYFVFWRKSSSGIARLEYFENMQTATAGNTTPKGIIPLSSCLSIEKVRVLAVSAV
jgi:hypothetical protein